MNRREFLSTVRAAVGPYDAEHFRRLAVDFEGSLDDAKLLRGAVSDNRWRCAGRRGCLPLGFVRQRS